MMKRLILIIGLAGGLTLSALAGEYVTLQTDQGPATGYVYNYGGAYWAGDFQFPDGSQHHATGYCYGNYIQWTFQ